MAITYFLDGANVAETTYPPFGRKAPLVRLIVRRVPADTRVPTRPVGQLLLPRLRH